MQVADAFNNRVQVFTPDGRYLRHWGGIGFGVGSAWPGWFRLAKELAFDGDGNVYVADAFNRRIQKFTPDGGLLAIWEARDQELRYASAVAVGAEDTVYVGDFYTSVIREMRCE